MLKLYRLIIHFSNQILLRCHMHYLGFNVSSLALIDGRWHSSHWKFSRILLYPRIIILIRHILIKHLLLLLIYHIYVSINLGINLGRHTEYFEGHNIPLNHVETRILTIIQVLFWSLVYIDCVCSLLSKRVAFLCWMWLGLFEWLLTLKYRVWLFLATIILHRWLSILILPSERTLINKTRFFILSYILRRLMVSFPCTMI